MSITEYNHQVQPVILSHSDVLDLLPRLDVQQELTAIFGALGANNAVQPPQGLTIFPQDKGDFITYMGAVVGADVFGAKLSPYLVTQDRPIITAWTNLMSSRTGQPLLWCDSGLLTTERTAGTTAIAVNHLAKQDSTHLAIIGSGDIAMAHLRHVLDLRQWQSIRVYSPSLHGNSERTEKFLAIDKRVVCCDCTGETINDADVIMLCTSSGTPVIELKNLTKPALITSISTNVANAHEVSPVLLQDADVYCDYKATTPQSAGEMVLAAAEHQWSPDKICGDLSDLINNNCPLPDYSKTVFFRSIGLGLEDVAMAYGIWKLLQNQD
jgi:L-arginine dehydrogenase